MTLPSGVRCRPSREARIQKEAEEEARDYRQALGIRDNQALPAKSLANHLGIRIMSPDQIPGLDSSHSDWLSNLDSKWSAGTVEIPELNRIFIVYNPAHSEPRQESDAMHEMAHIIRQHPPTGMNGSFRHYDQQQEEEAQYLGACLQITRAGLLWALVSVQIRVA